MKAKDLPREVRTLLRYINDTPELLSLLYDLDMMPEECPAGSHDFQRMLILASYHRNRNSTLTA